MVQTGYKTELEQPRQTHETHRAGIALQKHCMQNPGAAVRALRHGRKLIGVVVVDHFTVPAIATRVPTSMQAVSSWTSIGDSLDQSVPLARYTHECTY